MPAFIYDAVRTPRGRGKAGVGALVEVSPIALAAAPLLALAIRSGVPRDSVDDVILGCVDPVGDEAGDMARSAALLANLGEGVPGVQINRFCASGLEAVAIAASRVSAGDADLIMAGGVEMMSRVAMGGSGAPFLTDPTIAIPHFMIPQAISADLLATRQGYSRTDVDAYAVRSQQRAARAWNEGRFARSVVPVRDENGLLILDRDEAIRPDADMQSLGALEPSFVGLGEMAGFAAVALQRYPDVEAMSYVHHAGNSSQIVDGAAAVLVGSEQVEGRLGLKPRARILGSASIGCEPTIMLTGPAEACRRALGRAGLDAQSVDLWELNEAFASVVLYFQDEMRLDPEVVNVNGGWSSVGEALGG